MNKLDHFTKHYFQNFKRHFIFWVMAPLSILFFSNPGSASVYSDPKVYSGLLVSKDAGNSLYLRDQGNLLSLQAVTPELKEQLKQLSVNDFVSISGHCCVEGKVQTTLIHFVGLKRLLGVWQAGDTFYRFKDFNRMNIDLPKTPNPSGRILSGFLTSPPNTLKFNYTIFPSHLSETENTAPSPSVDNQTWNIVLGDQSSMMTGYLSLNSESGEQIDIRLIDPNTGNQSVVILRKVRDFPLPGNFFSF